MENRDASSYKRTAPTFNLNHITNHNRTNQFKVRVMNGSGDRSWFSAWRADKNEPPSEITNQAAAVKKKKTCSGLIAASGRGVPETPDCELLGKRPGGSLLTSPHVHSHQVTPWTHLNAKHHRGVLCWGCEAAHSQWGGRLRAGGRPGRAARGSEPWTRSDWVCPEDGFVVAVALAAHLLRAESQICKTAASQRLRSAVGQTKK